MSQLDLHIDAAASEARKKLLIDKYKTEPWFVNACANADPTPNGQYTEWLVKTFKDTAPAMEEQQLEDLFEDLTEILTDYGRLKNNPEWVRQTTQRRGKDAANIQTYTFFELKQILSEATRESLSKKEQERELRRKRDKYLEEGARLIGPVGDDIVCYEAAEAEAAVLLAEGSHWCTKNLGTARNYLSRGSLYCFMQDDESRLVPYAQCYVPNDEEINRFEFENADGHDLYSERFGGRAQYIDYDSWWMIEFLARNDSHVKDYINWKMLYTEGMDEPEFEECNQCGGFIEEDSDRAIHIEDPVEDTTVFCSRDCFAEYYESYVEEQVSDLVIYDESEYKEAEKQMGRLLYEGGGSPLTQEAVTVMIAAAKRQGLKNTTTQRDEYEFEPSWYMGNAATAIRMFDNGRGEGVHKIMPEATPEMMKALVAELEPLISVKDKKGFIRDVTTEVLGQIDYDLDVRKTLEELDYNVKPQKQSSLLLKRAKAIQIPDRFINVLMDLVYDIFKDHAYRDAEPTARLKDVVKRDTVWEIEKADWEALGVDFKRSGGLALEGMTLILETDQRKATVPGQPTPVIYSAGVREDAPGYPTLVLTLNGNLTVGVAMEQLQQHDSNIKLILKHEMAHVYDRQLQQDKSNYTEEDLDDDSQYFNMPHEARAWVNSLLEEFAPFISNQEGELRNELVNAFLKKSRVWALLSQHLNAQNRRFALRELSRELEIQKGKRHGQMVDRSPIRR